MSEMTRLEAKNYERLLHAAGECTVLLKSDGRFPLAAPCKVALYGNGARRTLKGGTGSGGVNSRFYITVEEGLERAGFTVTTKAWLDAYDTERASRHAQFLAGIKEKAQREGVSLFVAGFGAVEPEYDYDLPLEGEGDVAVYVLARVSGEGNDRNPVEGDICLTKTETRDILTLSRQYEKFILVLNVGGVVDLTPVKSVQNILYLSQLGVVTGDVFAEILLGKQSPSGKLTTTWTGFSDYCSAGDFGDRDDTHYREGIYVGYRYFDAAKIEPLFPFGHGLSYTRFDIRFLSCRHEQSTIILNVLVKNSGKYAGKEVIQLYASCPDGRLDKAEKGLVAFAKSMLLQPEEEQTIELSFDMKDIASYDTERACFVLERGNYALMLGNSSRAVSVCTVVRLEEDVTVKKVKRMTARPDFEDIKFVRSGKREECQNMIRLYRSDFQVTDVSYPHKTKIHPLAETLSDTQLARLCVGAYLTQTSAGVIGSSSFHVAGAAGETTNRLTEVLGKKYVVMADGPAGLRLTRTYIRGENDTVIPLIKELPDGLGEILDPAVTAYLRQVYDNTPKDKVLEQYTTAIPIGTAIAQSWNTEFAYLCGDIVGKEMEEFGIHIWLAPALNIHRDIRCGRNFEYYSEDPVISGKMAASIVSGVQSHKNCGVAIKHFAANNQETNRYNNNSIVSERALREIYLKGFEICIAESSPKTLMTSYNLINGAHTSENRELVTDILRCEFGFQGVVMTDWITTGMIYDPRSKHPPVYASNIVKAGNDLTMAGAQADIDDLEKAIADGKLLRRELLECASRVLYLIDALNE